MFFKIFIISCVFCFSFEEETRFKTLPRNIAVSPETSNFNFDCEVLGNKGVSRKLDEFIMSDNKIGDNYEDFYEANNSTVIYTKAAKEYTNDMYHDCIVFPYFRRARAVFAILSNFSCDLPEKIREGEIMNADMSIKFTHFSPSSKCNLGLVTTKSTNYENLNNQTEKLEGTTLFNHTATVVKSMNGQTLACEIFYDESQDSLTSELNHLKNIQKEIGAEDSVDTKQPKLLKSTFKCERKLEIEYGAGNITISINGIIALCEYDSYPKSLNFTWSIKQDDNIMEKLSTVKNVLDLKAYQSKYVQVSCDVRVDFYDGSFSVKSSEYSKKTYVVKEGSTSSFLKANLIAISILSIIVHSL